MPFLGLFSWAVAYYFALIPLVITPDLIFAGVRSALLPSACWRKPLPVAFGVTCLMPGLLAANLPAAAWVGRHGRRQWTIAGRRELGPAWRRHGLSARRWTGRSVSAQKVWSVGVSTVGLASTVSALISGLLPAAVWPGHFVPAAAVWVWRDRSLRLTVSLGSGLP